VAGALLLVVQLVLCVLRALRVLCMLLPAMRPPLLRTCISAACGSTHAPPPRPSSPHAKHAPLRHQCVLHVVPPPITPVPPVPQALVGGISNVLEALRAEGVPAPAVRAVAWACLRFIDGELLNALLLRRDCCSVSAAKVGRRVCVYVQGAGQRRPGPG
jgi:hypothetical protein